MVIYESDWWGFWAGMLRLALNTAVLIIINIWGRNKNPYIVTMWMLASIILFDGVDSIIPQMKYGWNWVKKPTISPALGDPDVLYEVPSHYSYQMSDKIIDCTLVAMVIILHILRVGGMVSVFEWILVILFGLRLFGVILFEITQDSIWLVIFPEFITVNVLLYLFLVYVLDIQGVLLWTIMIISIPFKYLQEIILHMKSFHMQGKISGSIAD